jgi:serine/threonine protein kinase
VVEFDLLLEGRVRRVIFKRFRASRWTDPMTHCWRATPALRSWINGHVFLDRGLPTARPLAVLQWRHGGFVFDSYLLTEKLDGAMDLRTYVDQLPRARSAQHRNLIESVAGLIRGLHDRGLSHRDLKAANVLIVTEPGDRQAAPELALPFRQFPRLYLIDLVGVERRGKLRRARKVQNLARLHVSFHHHPRVTRSDKLRFLRSYLRWGVHGKAGWKQWWREIAAATARKIAQNQCRGRPLA